MVGVLCGGWAVVLLGVDLDAFYSLKRIRWDDCESKVGERGREVEREGRK